MLHLARAPDHCKLFDGPVPIASFCLIDTLAWLIRDKEMGVSPGGTGLCFADAPSSRLKPSRPFGRRSLTQMRTSRLRAMALGSGRGKNGVGAAAL